MSFTAQTLTQIIKATSSIQKRTMSDNDLTEILKGLYTVLEVSEKIVQKNNRTEFYWNEILSELVAVIHSSISGYSRLGISGLRNILELLCHSFYYHDHPIELKLSINENMKSRMYVTALVNDHHFFTTRYIKTFNSKIEQLEIKPNGVSNFLKFEYHQLCDVVHGRHNTLTKQASLKIKYSKGEFKNFETHFITITSLIANMYLLRFEDYSNPSIINLAKKIKLLRL